MQLSVFSTQDAIALFKVAKIFIIEQFLIFGQPTGVTEVFGLPHQRLTERLQILFT